MSYFPFFINIENKAALIAGGGKIAFRKALKLLPFNPILKVVSPNICCELQNLASENNIELIMREVTEEDIDNAFFVIAATDNNEINSKISEWCKNKCKLINVVDDINKCSFIFPALIKEKDLSVAISTNGKNPETAKYLKEILQEALPEHIADAISALGCEREKIKNSVYDVKKRKLILSELALYAQKSDFLFTNEDLAHYTNALLEKANEEINEKT